METTLYKSKIKTMKTIILAILFTVCSYGQQSLKRSLSELKDCKLAWEKFTINEKIECKILLTYKYQDFDPKLIKDRDLRNFFLMLTRK